PVASAAPEAASAAVLKFAGTAREAILASPPRLLASTGTVYRRARLFDVSERVPGFEVESLVRLPGRWADQAPILTTADLPSPLRSSSEVEFLRDTDRAAVLAAGGAIRAYPLPLLRRYGGVRDEVGGRPVFVCWNAWTQCVRAFIGRSGDGEVDWRDSGLLYRGNHVYYDEETGSLWDSYDGQALCGSMAGERLEELPCVTWPWAQWRAENPSGEVLAVAEEAETPAEGEEGYLRSSVIPFPLKSADFSEDALEPKDFVLGVTLDRVSRAYPLGALADNGTLVVKDAIGGQRFDVHVTSHRTGYAVADGHSLNAPVMLWFAWKLIHPDSDIYTVPSSAGGP
ncbi:MAG: DUF3179 domain-containing (seleno)protein, partial [Candidatus Brocadiaceae bacterium]